MALLNDCKYGYDIVDDVIRLSLLRGPGWPDPEADQGKHRFAYALLPHRGDLRAPDEYRSGRMVQHSDEDRKGPRRGAGCVDRPTGVVLRPSSGRKRPMPLSCESAKCGSRGPARVTLHRPFVSVSRTDMLERTLGPLTSHDGSVDLHLKPFELVTLRFELS